MSISNPIRITKCYERDICGAREVKTMAKCPLEWELACTVIVYSLRKKHLDG